MPVGDDQKQHLELTRDIATKFNNDFASRSPSRGSTATSSRITEPVIAGPATRVMSLKDGQQEDEQVRSVRHVARILLMDDADTIAKKIKRATTDPEPLPTEDKGLEGRAEADNLVGIYAALSDSTEGRRAARNSAGRAGARSSRRWPISPWPNSPPSPPRCAASSPTPATSTPSCATAPSAPGASPSRSMDDVRQIVGFVR